MDYIVEYTNLGKKVTDQRGNLVHSVSFKSDVVKKSGDLSVEEVRSLILKKLRKRERQAIQKNSEQNLHFIDLEISDLSHDLDLLSKFDKDLK